MEFVSNTGEKLEVLEITTANQHQLVSPKEDELILLWFCSDDNKLAVDGIEYSFSKNQVIGTSGLHSVAAIRVGIIKMLRFNRAFFCMLNPDEETDFQGLFYYGSSPLPVLRLDLKHEAIISAAWEMVVTETNVSQDVSVEVLHMIVQRILMLCASIHREQHRPRPLSSDQNQLFQTFHVLVDQHFREKHSVHEYASILNRSPKTLSNVFRKARRKSPLEYIQDRLHLEARRLLRYTEKPISEISIDLGFTDLQTFSRFYKNREGVSPLQFRNHHRKGKKAK